MIILIIVVILIQIFRNFPTEEFGSVEKNFEGNRLSMSSTDSERNVRQGQAVEYVTSTYLRLNDTSDF